MTQVAVGLFPDESIAERVVRELEAAGFSSEHLHVLAMPHYMPVTGMMSTPITSFAAALIRNLEAIGATETEAQAYLQGVLNGGALVIVSGLVNQLDMCTDIMNRNRATGVEELIGPEVPFILLSEKAGFPGPGISRISQGGARIFTW